MFFAFFVGSHSNHERSAPRIPPNIIDSKGSMAFMSSSKKGKNRKNTREITQTNPNHTFTRIAYMRSTSIT
jgi:hypothetical protein